MCGFPAPAEVVQLLQHLPSVEPYPHGVLRIPDASAGRPVLPGVAFFPGGTGLWMPDFQTQPEVFPVGEVMAIGQDFDSEASYHAILNLMRQGPCDPRKRNPATWGRLLQFLPRCGIAKERCFFTNFFMGLRQGNKAVGVFPGAADTAFEERCRQFVGQQLETQQARLVLTLGMQVPSRLAPLAQQLSHWQGVESSTRLDAVGPVVHNVEFPGVRSTCSVVALVHPSFRPSNVGRRKYGRFQGDDAEVEMVREALSAAG